MSFDPSFDPGLSVYFLVDIDAINLGSWATCSGLGVSMSHEQRTETNMGFFQNHLPGGVEYGNITFSRPCSGGSKDIVSWLNSFSLLPMPTVAEITCLDPAGKKLSSWSLWGVIPVKWTGPSFDAANLKVAEEQLEIAYQGFL
jgi:phage tail-like protein